MPRPISLIIKPSAIAYNLSVVKTRLHQAGSKSFVWGVIKANAYGHGIEVALPALQQADGLAMLDFNEALTCRQLGWKKPILMLEGFFQIQDLTLIYDHHLTPVVHNDEQIDLLVNYSRLHFPTRSTTSPVLPAIYLKINTGMNRLGFKPETFRVAYDKLLKLKEQGLLSAVHLMTHFAQADTQLGVQAQLDVFNQITMGLSAERSLANSAATLRYPETYADWVRPGIILYGASPFNNQTAAQLQLKPAMTLRSELIAIQSLHRGDAVGYGGEYIAPQPMRIGVVACGYADGYPRHAPQGTPVSVGGMICPLVGRISMDMLTVDLSNAKQSQVGNSVILWGEGGPSVDEVALYSGTIAYELMCAVSPRVPRQLDSAA